MTAAILPFRNREASLRRIYDARNAKVMDHMTEMLVEAVLLELASDPEYQALPEWQRKRAEECF